MNNLTIWLILNTIVIAVAVLAFFYFRRKQAPQQDVSQNILLELVEGLRRELKEANHQQRSETSEQMDRIHTQLHRSQTDAQKIIQDVTEQLTKIDATNKQVLDFSSQLNSLQNILKNPKHRGVLGEYWLESLLANVLPPDSYKMQHNMGIDDETHGAFIADAAIFIRERVIPIDAKFSLENYNRMVSEETKEGRERMEKEFKADVKKRIDETAKYIQPQFGTMGFAFMFIPAEGVYYALLNAEVGSSINSTNLIEYAFSKHVLIVSPTSFFAYLQTVLLGLRELQIEKSTQEILKRVDSLGRHIHQYVDLHDRLGKNLATTVNQFNSSSKELLKIDKDVHKLTSGVVGGSLELDDVDKPQIEA